MGANLVTLSKQITPSHPQNLLPSDICNMGIKGVSLPSRVVVRMTRNMKCLLKALLLNLWSNSDNTFLCLLPMTWQQLTKRAGIFSWLGPLQTWIIYRTFPKAVEWRMCILAQCFHAFLTGRGLPLYLDEVLFHIQNKAKISSQSLHFFSVSRTKYITVLLY